MAQMQQSPFENIGVNKISTFQGNMVPHSWYTQITSDSGKPDLNAISLFSEIFYWYRPSREGRLKFKGDVWQTSYEHFESRFFYNKQRIRRGLVRLEELGLIRRELRTIEKYGQKYSNVLFIKLLAIPQEDVVSSNASVNSKNVRPEISSGKLLISPSSEDNTDSYNKKQSFCLNKISLQTIEKNKKIYLSLDKFDTPSLQICREHYIEEENNLENKNRSDMRKRTISESNSLIISDLEKIQSQNCKQPLSDPCISKANQKNIPEIPAQSLTDTLKTRFWKKIIKPFQETPDWPEGRGLIELATLSKNEVSELNKLSSREFSQNFINQLILKLGHKNPEHKFFKKKSFMNYMVKAIKNEIIQAPQANNIDFKFACITKTAEEKFQARVDKYAQEIESSTVTTQDMLLKKKILGRLDPSIAYEVLTGASITLDPNDDVSCKIKILRPLKIQGAKYKKITEIPEWIRQIIFEEVSVVYGNQVFAFEYDDLDTNFASDSCISNELNKAAETPHTSDNLLYSSDIPLSETIDNPSPTELMWLRVRNKLKEMYGDKTYRSWFSGLKIEPNNSSKLLKIEAPTTFIRDWVKKDYGNIIEQVIKMEEPSIQFVEFASN